MFLFQKMSKEDARCPICHMIFQNVGRHLKKTHHVENVDEKKILVNMATGHVNIRTCPCPIATCQYKSGKHLDRHILNHHTELSQEKRRNMLKEAKYLRALQLLSQLRQTSPRPEMVTSLDVEVPEPPVAAVSQETSGSGQEPTGTSSGAPGSSQTPCDNESCAAIIRE